jgi:hypothetical protein
MRNTLIVRTVPRHCENPACKKCRAQFRWYRRKAWQVSKRPNRNGRRRK